MNGFLGKSLDEIDTFAVLKFDDGQGKEQYVVAKVDVVGQDE